MSNFEIVDTRGYRFEGCEKPLNLTIVTHDIVVLLDALNISKAHAVLGVSLGGTTAITFAIQYPDRLSKGFVASDIFINASLANSTAVDTRVTCAKMCGMPAIAPTLVPGWFTSNATNGPIWNEALSMVSNASADGMGAINPVPNKFYDTVNPKDLQHPGFYIVGKEDDKTQGFMKEFVANNTPNEGLHEVGGSHLCLWENADDWADAVKDFLSESA